MSAQRLLLSTILRHYEPYDEILFSYFQGIHFCILLRKWRLNYQQDLDAEMRKLKNNCHHSVHIPQILYHMMKSLDEIKTKKHAVVETRYDPYCKTHTCIPSNIMLSGLEEFQCIVVWVFTCIEWLKQFKVESTGIEFSKLTEMYINPCQQFLKFQERFQGGTKTLIKLEDILAFLQYASSVTSLFIVSCRILNVGVDEELTMLVIDEMIRKSDLYYQYLNPDKSIPLRTHYKKILAPCFQVDLYHGLQGWMKDHLLAMGVVYKRVPSLTKLLRDKRSPKSMHIYLEGENIEGIIQILNLLQSNQLTTEHPAFYSFVVWYMKIFALMTVEKSMTPYERLSVRQRLQQLNEKTWNPFSYSSMSSNHLLVNMSVPFDKMSQLEQLFKLYYTKRGKQMTNLQFILKQDRHYLPHQLRRLLDNCCFKLEECDDVLKYEFYERAVYYFYAINIIEIGQLQGYFTSKWKI